MRAPVLFLRCWQVHYATDIRRRALDSSGLLRGSPHGNRIASEWPIRSIKSLKPGSECSASKTGVTLTNIRNWRAFLVTLYEHFYSVIVLAEISYPEGRGTPKLENAPFFIQSGDVLPRVNPGASQSTAALLHRG